MDYAPPTAPGPGGAPTPGWLGMTPGALGLGSGVPGYGISAFDMAQSQRMAASMFGGSALNMGVGGVNAGMNALQFGSMTIAPLMAAHGSTMMTRGLGMAWAAADPFAWAMGAGRAGWSMAEGAGLGMGSRVALGGLMGTGVGAAAYAALQVPMSWAQHSLAGARTGMLGQSTLAAVGASAFPGRGGATPGQGASLGNEMSTMARDLYTNVDDLAQVTRQLEQMKVFESTRTVSEFRSRLKEVLGAIKDIAKTTKQSLEEATQTFGELRQQGFYSTSDITAQASKRAALSSVSGVSQADLSQYGSMGAQYARSLGMRGKYGADYMAQSVASMASAYRGMSEGQREVVDEYGGPEQMAASLAAKQMRFLSSSRGRAMIAATMGADGRPDANAMGELLSGNMSTEAIVERAAGRGLGTLYASGSGRVREQYMQYAGPMQLMMAASQAKQLYGGYNLRSMYGMMNTMGYNYDETRTLLAQTMQMPRVLEEQQGAQDYAAQQSDYTQRKRESSWYGQATRGWNHITDSWEVSGSRAWAGAADAWQRTANNLTGYHETTVGPEGVRMARDFVRGGGTVRSTGARYLDDSGFFGPDSARSQIGSQYSAYAQKGIRMAGRPGEAPQYKIGGQMYDASDVIELEQGSTGKSMSVMLRSDLAEAESIKGRTLSKDLAATAKEKLDYGDYLQGSLGGRLFGLGGMNFGAGGKVGENLDGDVQYYKGQAGSKGLTDEEIAAYAVWKKADPSAPSLEAFSKLKTTDKKAFTQAVTDAAGLMRAGGASNDEVLRRLGPAGASGGTLSRAEAKKRLTGKFSTFLKEGGMKNWIGHGGEALTESVTSNSEVAAAFDRYMKAEKPGAERTAALEQMEKLLGRDSAAFGDVLKISKMDELDQQAVRRGYAYNGIGDALGEAYTADILGATSDREKAALSSREGRIFSKKESRRSKAEEDALAALGRTGETDVRGRAAAYKQLFSSMASGGFSADELTFLTGATGGTGASTMASLLQSAAGGDKGALKSLGIDEGKLKGKKGDDRLQAVIEEAVKNGTIDPAMLTEGATKKSVDGSKATDTSYVEANAKFVTAVDMFVHRLGTEFPALKSAGDDVTQTASVFDAGKY